MLSKVVILFAVFVAVNATGLALNYAVPAKTIVSTHYASPVIAPVAVVPVVKTHIAPVAIAHAGPVGYSRSYETKYFGAPKVAVYNVGHVAPVAVPHGYSTSTIVKHAAPVAVAHGYSTSTVVKHAAPVFAAHAAPVVVGHGLLGHRLGGIVYNGHKSIVY